jgi:hypothetical protein
VPTAVELVRMAVAVMYIWVLGRLTKLNPIKISGAAVFLGVANVEVAGRGAFVRMACDWACCCEHAVTCMPMLAGVAAARPYWLSSCASACASTVASCCRLAVVHSKGLMAML